MISLWKPQTGTHPALGYLVAVLSILAATLLRWAIDPIVGHDLPYITYFVAVIVTAWYAGLWPSVLACLLGLVLADFLFVTPRGTLFTTELADQLGMALYFLVTVSSIVLSEAQRRTERRLRVVEAALRQEREKLALTLTSIGEGIITCDADGKVTYLNAIAETLTGWRAREAVGRPFDTVFPVVDEETGQPANPRIMQALGSGRAVGVSNHTMLTTRDGRTIPIADSATPILNAARQPEGMVLVFHDDTERRQHDADQRLREQEREALIEALPQLIWTCRPDGSCDYVSPQWAAYTGVRAEEQIGTGWMSALHPEDRARTQSTWNEAVTDQVEYAILYRLRRYDGEYRWFDVRAVPLCDDSGQVTKWFGSSTDIDELKQAQDTADQEQRRLAAVLETMPVGVGIADQSGALIMNNPQTARIWGGSAPLLDSTDQYAEYKGWWPDTGKPIASEEWALARAVHKGETSIGEVINIQRFDGTLGTILNSATPIYGVSGQIVGGVAALMDITELKQVQDALRQSEARFHSVFENAAIGIAITDWAGRFQECNPAYANLLGYTEAALLQMEFTSLIHPEDREANLVQIRRLQAGEIPSFEIENRYIRMDGAPVWVRKFVSALHGDSDKEQYLLALVTDISERKRSQDRIRSLYTVTSALAAALSPEDVAAVILEHGLEAVGASDGSICLLVDADTLEMIRAVGLPEAITERWRRFPVDSALPIGDVVRRGEPVWLENEQDRLERYPSTTLFKDYAGAWALLPLQGDNRVLGVLTLTFPQSRTFNPEDRGYLQSLAQQCSQALERARLYATEQQARMAAEEANALKSEFLAMVSHELRTPLTPIIGFSTTLLDLDVKWSLEQYREFVQAILQEAERLRRLVDQLLEVSQLQARTLEIQWRAITIPEIVAESIPALRAIAPDHPIQLDLAQDLPVVRADPERISRVLSHLGENVARHTPAGTTITIRARAEKGKVQVSVSDDGPGIPATARDYVFEPFRQVTRSEGAGLGLAICKGIIEAHGERIWIDDNAPHGTSLCFTLPVNEEESR